MQTKPLWWPTQIGGAEQSFIKSIRARTKTAMAMVLAICVGLQSVSRTLRPLVWMQSGFHRSLRPLCSISDMMCLITATSTRYLERLPILTK